MPRSSQGALSSCRGPVHPRVCVVAPSAPLHSPGLDTRSRARLFTHPPRPGGPGGPGCPLPSAPRPSAASIHHAVWLAPVPWACVCRGWGWPRQVGQGPSPGAQRVPKHCSVTVVGQQHTPGPQGPMRLPGRGCQEVSRVSASVAPPRGAGGCGRGGQALPCQPQGGGEAGGQRLPLAQRAVLPLPRLQVHPGLSTTPCRPASALAPRA